jgi:quinol monooxygenase YgiN
LALRRKGANPPAAPWPNASIDPRTVTHRQRYRFLDFPSGLSGTTLVRRAPEHSDQAACQSPPDRPLRRMARQHRRRKTMNSSGSNQGFVITAFWETKPGEEDSVAGLLRKFLPEARKEAGVKEFQIHQSVTKPLEFFFYEVFSTETAFAAHQQTEHFKKFILGEAIPKLAKRERSQFRFI